MKKDLEQELYDLTEQLAYDNTLSNDERDDIERQITELDHGIRRCN